MKANERGIAERTKHGRRLSLMAKLGGGTALLALLLVAVTAGSAVVIFSNYLIRMQGKIRGGCPRAGASLRWRGDR